MVCHPDCRARCRHRVYLQVLPPSRVFCRPLFKGGAASVRQAAEPLQVVLFEGEGVGEATGREVGRGPVRRSPACRGLRASACALPAACKFHSPATRLAFPGSAPLINLFGLTRAE